MTGWLILLGAVLVTGAMIWRWTRLPRDGQQLVAAFLLLGLAGYAWQGNPGLAGKAVATKAVDTANPGSVSRFSSVRMGPIAETLGYADAWLRAGRPDLAVRAINIGLKTQPKSPDLWLAMGSALAEAGGGMLTPPARFSLAKARALNAEHPGVLFFEGLSAAQDRDIAGAARAWLKLYQATPQDAPWREDLEMRLAAIAQMVQQSQNSASSGTK